MAKTLTVNRWELRKLRAQKRTYLGLGAAVAEPIIFVVALAIRNGEPRDVAFGRYVHDTGPAIPLVLLLFGSVWLFPLITALVAASLLVYLLPILAVASIGLLFSTVFRNSAAAIVGTLMFSLLLQLIGILPGLGGLQPYLLSTQFQAWQGFLRVPVDWAPIIRALRTCALYGVPSLVIGAIVFLRRDVAGE